VLYALPISSSLLPLLHEIKIVFSSSSHPHEKGMTVLHAPVVYATN
jgi:hypothetical protein